MQEPTTMSASAEGDLLARLFLEDFPVLLSAHEAILSMKEGGSPNWRQMEWIGFYPEHWFNTTHTASLGAMPGPRFGKTTIDIQLQHIWDFKAHSATASAWSPLNDREAVETCIENFGGIGFVILTGQCSYDLDGSFRKWHDEIKGEASAYSKTNRERNARSRLRKTSFRLRELTVFRMESLDDLKRAQSEGWLRGFQGGMRNSNNKSRRPKISVNIPKIRDWALIRKQLR